MDESYFARPFVEVDEWRDEPVRHRYVHGGFDGTETEFSLYFPPAEQYEGRFLHHVEGGGGGTPRAQPGDIALACRVRRLPRGLEPGPHGPRRDAPRPRDPPLRRERRDGASLATCSRRRCTATPPHHGYIWGGSGGAGRTIAILEHAPDLYQGAVVYILPHVAQQVLCAAVANAARVLGDGLARVVDATAPGGSGDPFAGLDAEQRAALADVYRLGFPRGAEDQIYPVSIALERRGSRARRLRSWLLRRLLDRTGVRRHHRKPPRRAHPVDARRPARCSPRPRSSRARPSTTMDPYQYLAVAGIARTRPDMPIGVIGRGPDRRATPSAPGSRCAPARRRAASSSASAVAAT